ncbi:MAG: peptidylprolyl isomerase [Desulfuromonadales bacterium]|jgi:hypothetical protein
MNNKRPGQRSGRIKEWLREPLLHFLLIGALLFLVFQLRGGGGPGTNRIVITPGQVESMTARFLKIWQRPPTGDELKGMIDDHVRGEMAAREAIALGLDQGDTIIQRRLRQKLEFLAEDMNSVPPTDAELQSWLEGHPETYRVDARITFRQVYLNPDRHGATLEKDAGELLARLQKAGLKVDSSNLGDSLMLPHQLPLTSESGISRQFGQAFTEALFKAEPGGWTGPIRSGFGLHLVYVEAREDARMPDLAEVRPAVERDLLADRRKRALEEMYEALLQRYQVTIERPKSDQGEEVATTDRSAGDRP